MATVDKPRTIPAGDLAAPENAVVSLIRGVRDPDQMDRAPKEMDEGREEVRE